MTTLTNDSLLAVADRLGVQTLPLVLAVGPQQDTFEAWQAARDAAVAELAATGIFDTYGDVEPGLADAMHILAQPDAELVARSYGDDDRRRICLARRGAGHAGAVRTGSTFDITTSTIDGSDRELTRLLLAALPPCAPAEIAGVSVAADELASRLDAAETTSQYVDAMYALGIDAHQATVLGAAFGTCRGYTEIVAVVHHNGLTTRAPGAVAVYDTARGRIVVAPSTAPDGQLWSTMTPGTDHRLTQAVGALLEGLPGGGWRPD
ncbi:ESX secretion-associated protein EspG [Nocardia mangyaensis]|uniref:ESX secretion-associated protein EspG n=1 Tax=Nocardia mangyaensis TaxID=2213200 RepID=UPI0026764BD4|nr:ESX secretion-associated protein EspG [Nocardia mangyaensis]MDO3647284.1 ESX secretion-associated protein EspG [Nocardia mangyaensis]